MFNGLDYLAKWQRLKAAIYVRVSTNVQAEKGYGLEAQITACKKMCEIKNYDIVDIYTDGGVSGIRDVDKRKDFIRLLTDAEQNKFSVLVFYAFDRLARDIRVFMNIVDNLKKFNIKIVSCKEQIDTTTDTGEFMMNIYASVNQLELKTIKARMAMGREEKRKESGYVGGYLPYGYSMVDKKIEINPEHANIVKIIFNACHNLKLSYREIGRRLTNDGVPPPIRAKKWHQTSVISIMDHKEKYEGGLIYGNENDIRWPKILDKIYPHRPTRK